MRYTVKAFVCNFNGSADLFAENVSELPLRATLRLALELIGGIPGAWCGIRDARGELVADLETDWRGELSGANVYAQIGMVGPAPCVKVTALNINGPIFAGVFAV